MQEVVVTYGAIATAALLVTQLLKGLGPFKGIEPQKLAVVVAEAMALLGVVGGQIPASGLMEVLKLMAGAALGGATAVGVHTVAVKPLEPETPLEPVVLPTSVPVAVSKSPDQPVVTVFFRRLDSMNPSEGIWKTFETVAIPKAAYADFRLHGATPVFALGKGHGVSNPPVETKEHGVISQILTDIKAENGSRVDVFCK